MNYIVLPNPPAQRLSRVRMISLVGVFAAISAILMFIEVPIPFLPPFLKIDLSGVPYFNYRDYLYGPVPAVCVTIVKDLVHLLSTQTGGCRRTCRYVGTFFLRCCFFPYLPQVFFPKGVALSVGCGVVTITVIGSLANKFMLIPFYSKVMPLEAIIDACHVINPMIDSMDAYVLFGLPNR